MRLVVDIVIVANACAALCGFLWRRHHVQKRNANLEHIKQKELEIKEMDEILEGMGVNDVNARSSSTSRGPDRSYGRKDPQERGVRRSERGH